MRRLSLPVAALLFGFVSGPALAETAGELCDKLAGNADDADFTGQGVEYDDIDVAAAEPACRQAVAENPDERRYAFELARVLRRKGDTAGAIPLFEKAGGMGSAIALVGLGLIYENGDGVPQDYVKAGDLYRKAMELGSDRGVGNLALLYHSGFLAGGPGEAKPLYEKLAAKGDGYGIIDLGSLYQWGQGTGKDIKKAEEFYRQAMTHADPDIVIEGKNMLAWMYAIENINLAEADTLIGEAVAAYPDEPAYQDTLAWVRYRQGRLDEALAASLKASELDSEDPGYAARLGDIYAAKGDMAKAKAAWEKAVALPPPDAYHEPDWNADAIRKKIAGAG